MSERGLDRDYVAVLEPRAQKEAEEEARARALSPSLRGHERREGGERKKENICSDNDSSLPTGGDTETINRPECNGTKRAVKYFFLINIKRPLPIYHIPHISLKLDS